jgi:hypothetical protein
MSTLTVNVWDEPQTFTTYRKYKTVWVASGDTKVNRIASKMQRKARPSSGGANGRTTRAARLVTPSNSASTHLLHGGRCVAGNRYRASAAPLLYIWRAARRAEWRRRSEFRRYENSTRTKCREISESRHCWIGSHGFPAARGSDKTESHQASGGSSSVVSIIGRRSRASFSICSRVGIRQDAGRSSMPYWNIKRTNCKRLQVGVAGENSVQL